MQYKQHLKIKTNTIMSETFASLILGFCIGALTVITFQNVLPWYQRRRYLIIDRKRYRKPKPVHEQTDLFKHQTETSKRPFYQ